MDESSPIMADEYEGRPSKKKPGIMHYLMVLIIIGGLGAAAYYVGPTLVEKFKIALGWYDNQDENNVIADHDNE